MAASRKVNDFWVAPILLENMREGMVQVDAWSYSQAMDASNAMGSWQASLQRLGFKAYLEFAVGLLQFRRSHIIVATLCYI